MGNIFGSILSDDIIDKIQDGLPDWMKNTVWSQSDVKNFIYKELHDRVGFKVPKNHRLVVDDYILLDELDPAKVTADYTNDRQNASFSYRLYGTRLNKLNLSSYRTRIPTIVPWESTNKHQFLTFRVRFGADDPIKDIFHRWYWPEKDGEWVVYVSKNFNRVETIGTARSNFDGHIPSSELR